MTYYVSTVERNVKLHTLTHHGEQLSDCILYCITGSMERSHFCTMTVVALLLMYSYGEVLALTCYECDSRNDNSCGSSTATDSWQECDGDVCYALTAAAFSIQFPCIYYE